MGEVKRDSATGRLHTHAALLLNSLHPGREYASEIIINNRFESE